MHNDTNLMACLEKGQRHRESCQNLTLLERHFQLQSLHFDFLMMKSFATALQGLCSHTLVFINTLLFPPSSVFAHLSPATSPKLHHFPSALNLPPFLFPLPHYSSSP